MVLRMTEREQIHTAFSELFPVKSESGCASLEYVTLTDEPRGFAVVLRLVVWDVNEETGVQSIRDIKEQQIYLGSPKLQYFVPFMNALAKVVSRVLSSPMIETMMPHDLVNFGVLKLANATTEADFVKALSVKSRLGKLLPQPSVASEATH
jgi:hypothetical protein